MNQNFWSCTLFGFIKLFKIKTKNKLKRKFNKNINIWWNLGKTFEEIYGDYYVRSRASFRRKYAPTLRSFNIFWKSKLKRHQIQVQPSKNRKRIFVLWSGKDSETEFRKCKLISIKSLWSTNHHVIKLLSY